MKRHLGSLVFLCSLTFLILACSQRSGGGSGALNMGAGNGGNQSGGDGGLVDFPMNDNGTMDLGGGFENAADSLTDSLQVLENTPGADENMIEGMNAAADSLDAFAQAFGGLLEDATPQQIVPVLHDIRNARQHAFQVAQLLWQLGLTDLARVFADEAHKMEVLRMYNPATRRHFFTLSRPEAFHASALYGYVLEGVAFRTFVAPRYDCKRLLYRCYVPEADDHFMSTDANCEGRTKEGAFGYVCAERRPYAFPEIYRLYNNANDHLATVSRPEVDYIVPRGWRLEATLGFAPN